MAGSRTEEARVLVEIARMPTTTADIVGREVYLSWLDDCWRDQVGVVAVVAMGGAGKSALVNAWLRAQQRRGWPGVERVFGWSFHAQGTDRSTSSDPMIDAALRWFGHEGSTPASPWDKGERLAQLVRKRPTFLVLDGLEPLQSGPFGEAGKLNDPAIAALVRGLAAENQGLCVVTTRVPVVDLATFLEHGAEQRNLDRLSADAGGRLLAKLGCRGTHEELCTAADEYNGHCLALTLLGAYLADVEDGDVRRRSRIPILELSDHRAESLMAAYESWFGDSPETSIIRLLGLFDRPAEPNEIAALRAPPGLPGLTDGLTSVDGRRWREALARLKRSGLLDVDSEGRLDAHSLVREYFANRLEREHPDAFREGHRRLYEHLRRQAKDLPDTLAEMAPLYAAAAHGFLAGLAKEAAEETWRRRIQRGDQFFNTNKLSAFGSEVAVLAAAFNPPWEKLRSGLPLHLEGAILSSAGFALRAMGLLDEAESLLMRALAVRTAIDDHANASRSASTLTELLLARGDLPRALILGRKAVCHADLSGVAFHRMSRRADLAVVHCALGRHDEAIALCMEAEEIQRAHDPAKPRLPSIAGFRFCDILLDRADSDVTLRAAELLGEASLARRGVLTVALARLACGRAGISRSGRDASADPALVHAHLMAAVDGLKTAGQQDYIPLGLLARAAYHLHVGERLAARSDLREALALSTRCGFRLHACDTHLRFARLSLGEGDLLAALGHLHAARAIIDGTGYHRRDGELAELVPMTRDLLIDSLSKLPPEQFSQLTSKLGLPESVLPGHDASPLDRAIALLYWADQNPVRVDELERCYLAVAAPSVAGGAPVGAGSSDRHPRPRRKSTKPKVGVDVGVVVALHEEIAALLDLVGDYEPCGDGGLNHYLFAIGNRRCVVTLIGRMGEPEAAQATSQQIEKFLPACVVNVGISGAIHEDLHVGDVFIPDQVVQYMQNGKMAPTDEGGFIFQPGPPAQQPDARLHTRIIGFDLNHRDVHAAWVKAARDDLAACVPNAVSRDRLIADGLVRPAVVFRSDGYEASGPVVGAAQAFSLLLRKYNRNIKAIDMESGAVLLAAQRRDTPRPSLTIRGISDFADHRKASFDAIGGGGLRRYAMRNAVRLLWALVDAGALPSLD